MKFEHALPAMRAGYVIGVYYPVNVVTTWYSKCRIHPHDVYVHGFSRVRDMIGQFPSSDVMRDDWVVGIEVIVETGPSKWFDNNPIWLDIDGEPTMEEINKAMRIALKLREDRNGARQHDGTGDPSTGGVGIDCGTKSFGDCPVVWTTAHDHHLDSGQNEGTCRRQSTRHHLDDTSNEVTR